MPAEKQIEAACRAHNVGWSLWKEPQKKTAREVMRLALTAAEQAQEAQPVVTPEDWQLVPIEPTREMWAAMADTLYGYKNRHHVKVAGDLFRAMLAAAPKPEDNK